jgi:hypothetical protein
MVASTRSGSKLEYQIPSTDFAISDIRLVMSSADSEIEQNTCCKRCSKHNAKGK